VIRRGLRAALVHGAAAFGAISLLGQVLAFIRTAGPADAAALEVVRAGGLVPSFVHRGPVSLELASVSGGAVFPGGFEVGLTLHLCLTLAAAVAGWLLYRGGRRASSGPGGGAVRIGLGAAVAVPYAVLSLLAAVVARGSDPAILLGPRFAPPGQAEAVPSLAWSFLLPLLLGAGCGIAGAISGLPRGVGGWVRWARAAAAGGWRMAWLAAVGGIAVILVVLAMNPGATRGFLDAIAARGPMGAAVVLTLTVLLLPNAGIGVALAATGAPVVLQADGSSCELLAYARLASATACGPLEVGPVSAAFGAVAIVPAAATVAGGWLAAERLGTRNVRFRAGVGALAGVALVPFAVVLGFLASVAYEFGGPLGRALGGGAEIGVPLLSAAVWSLVWGVPGGAMGGVLSGVWSERRDGRGEGSGPGTPPRARESLGRPDQAGGAIGPTLLSWNRM
jgi:hypothetical protein